MVLTGVGLVFSFFDTIRVLTIRMSHFVAYQLGMDI
jgi:hypothetical protein